MRTIPEIKKELMQAIIIEIGKHRYSLYDYSALDRAVGTALAEAANRGNVSEYIECRVCYSKNYLNNSKIIQEELSEYEQRVLKDIDTVTSRLEKTNSDMGSESIGTCPKLDIRLYNKLHDSDVTIIKNKPWWMFW